MLNKLAKLTFLLFLCSACTPSRPEIELCCEIDSAYNYTIKWDVYPTIEGTVKIYAATSPDKLTIDSEPIACGNINDGRIKVVSNTIMKRQYFIVSFNDEFNQAVATRAPLLLNIQNFRDIGGYKSESSNKTVRWGMIYRSGSLDKLDKLSIRRMQDLGIKTLIDFRSTSEFEKPSEDLHLSNVYNIPFTIHRIDTVIDMIKNGQFLRGDAMIYMQDIYGRFVRESTPNLKSMFNQLLVEDNYPIIISCSLGKDLTGISVSLILAALGIPSETIKEDYLLSNDYLKVKQIAPLFDLQPSSTQEAVTLLTTVNEKYFSYAMKIIDQEYGGLDNYLVHELGMTHENQKKLRELLLQ